MRDNQEREIDIIEATAELIALQVQAKELTDESTYIAYTEGSSHPATAYVTSCNEGKTWLIHLMNDYCGLYIKCSKAVSSEKEAIEYAEWVVGNTE